MEKKNCKNCLVEKNIELFLKRKDSLDGYRNVCKKCIAIQNKNYREIPENIEKEKLRNKIRWSNKIHNVYLLVKENYVGTTKNIQTRMSHHRSNGKDTLDYRILYSSENRKDCLELEELLHEIGYKGRHKNNMYK